jgi:RHS repeat-associated protein
MNYGNCIFSTNNEDNPDRDSRSVEKNEPMLSCMPLGMQPNVCYNAGGIPTECGWLLPAILLPSEPFLTEWVKEETLVVFCGVPQFEEKPTINFTLTARGFTGHEHYPYLKIINMNGRLYDPVIARFFSPDKYVANSSFTQDFNRYSYDRKDSCFKCRIKAPDYRINAYSFQHIGLPANNSIIKNCKDKKLRIFFIKEEIMREHSWEEICSKQLYEKKITLTEEELQQNNWVVVYE